MVIYSQTMMPPLSFPVKCIGKSDTMAAVTSSLTRVSVTQEGGRRASSVRFVAVSSVLSVQLRCFDAGRLHSGVFRTAHARHDTKRYHGSMINGLRLLGFI